MRERIANSIDHCTAENDLSANQHYIVEMSDANQVDVCDNAGDIPLGFLVDPGSAAGDAVRVSGVGSIVIGIAGGAITAPANVGTTAAGKLVEKTADEAWYIGILLDDAAADGDQVRVYQTGPLQIASA